jgi:hypothetical protein
MHTQRKLLFIVIVSLCITIIAKAQVSKGRATLLKTINNLDRKDSSTKLCDILMVLDEGEKKLKFFEPDREFDIVEKLKDEPYVQDKTISFKQFKMVDDNGKKCYVNLFISPKGLIYVSLIYQDYNYNYMVLENALKEALKK